jgi:hypothetical protein
MTVKCSKLEKTLTVYIVQNENHAINFSLDSKGKNSLFIYLDNLTGVKARNSHKGNLDNIIFLGTDNKKYFYRTNWWNKLCIIFNTRKEIDTIVKSITKDRSINIVIGNDGSLQKLIIYRIKKYLANIAHITVELWVDSLVVKKEISLKRYILSVVAYISNLFKISYLFPSEFCKSDLIDCIYTSDQSIIKTLVSNGVSENKIHIKKFPRVLYMSERVSSIEKKEERLLFLLGAWEWHGHLETELWQEKVVHNLIKLKEKENLQVDIAIRPHPRQSEEFRTRIGLDHISEFESFEEDILNSSIVLSFRSSGLLDAKLLGKTTLVFENGSPFKETNDFIESLTKIHNLNEIAKYT